MHAIDTIIKINNPKQRTETYATGLNTQMHTQEVFKSPACPYCYDGSIVNKGGELKCSACNKQVIIREVEE